jgi:hypothetical protein
MSSFAGKVRLRPRDMGGVATARLVCSCGITVA